MSNDEFNHEEFDQKIKQSKLHSLILARGFYNIYKSALAVLNDEENEIEE